MAITTDEKLLAQARAQADYQIRSLASKGLGSLQNVGTEIVNIGPWAHTQDIVDAVKVIVDDNATDEANGIEVIN